jgi:hypothetical protein
MRTRFPISEYHLPDQVFITLEIVWYAASVAVRASMLLLYMRLFPSRRFKMVCWFLIGLFCVILLTIILASSLICRPLSYSFVPTTPGGHCGDLPSFELYTATTSMLSDIIVVFLPMPILWKLQLAMSKKLGLIAIFGVGFMQVPLPRGPLEIKLTPRSICVLTLIRIFISRYYMVDNYTKKSAVVGLITALEPIIGVINVCLPFVPRIFAHASAFGRSTVAKSGTEDSRLKDFRANSLNSEKFSRGSSDDMSPGFRSQGIITHNLSVDSSNMV